MSEFIMTRLIPFFLALLSCISIAEAQEETSWKKQKKLAERLLEAGNFADAAHLFEQAWNKNPDEKELIAKAGENYFLVKDFKGTIRALQEVKEDYTRFPKAGLKYACSLKQDGQFEEALEAFRYFLDNYRGIDRAALEERVQLEISGCNLALQLLQNPVNKNLQLEHLDNKINSEAIEFAPVPYTEHLLYYSSTRQDGKSYLFRSQRKKGQWQKAIAAPGLPDFGKKHFANGTFSPDGKRFYFTLCENGKGLSSQCEIYALTRESTTWSDPIRLPDYINLEGFTNTQPWVIHKNNQEWLFFVSNRSEGMGGMDIWVVTRELSSKGLDFTFPANLGPDVNTPRDELTPFFHAASETLYFSSDGHTSIGGWDIFKTQLVNDTDWKTPQNMGFPVNSPADDFYYVLNPSGKGGFLSSNRRVPAQKNSTRHEDIFEFGIQKSPKELLAIGEVYDNEAEIPMSKVRVTLYELTEEKERLLSSKIINQSNYRFRVLPGKKYRLVARKDGYRSRKHEFNTMNITTGQFLDYDFRLDPGQDLPDSNVVFKPGEKDTTGSSTSSPTMSYKVQITAVNSFSGNHPRYQPVLDLGKLETEPINSRGLTRVLLSSYQSEENAEMVRQKAIQAGFPDAFIVRYRGTERIGRVWN